MFGSSFSAWVINLGIAVAWLAAAIATGNWFVAIGGVVFLGFTMLLELPDTSSDESDTPEDEGGIF